MSALEPQLLNDFDAAFSEREPLQALHALLVKKARSGSSIDALRSVLEQFRDRLRDQGRESDEDVVLDALDSLNGWCHPDFAITAIAREPADAMVLFTGDPVTDAILRDLVLPAVDAGGFDAIEFKRTLDEPGVIETLLGFAAHTQSLVCDLTAPNELTWYALGIAHASRIPTLVLAQNSEDVPPDVRSLGVLVYSARYDRALDLPARIQEQLAALRAGVVPLRTPLPHTADLPVRPMVATEETGEDEDKGLWDFVPHTEMALSELGTSAQELSTLTDELNERLTAATAEMNAAGSRGPAAHQAAILRNLRVVSAQLDDYAESVEGVNRRFDSAWLRLEENLTGFLALVDISSPGDVAEARSFADTIQELRSNASGASTGMGGMHDAMVDLRRQRLSKDLNRALSRAIDSVDGVLDMLRVGDAVLERLVFEVERRLP